MKCFQVFGREKLVWKNKKKKIQFLLRNVENQTRIEHAFKLADPKTGYTEEEDVHLWLLGDSTPSDPNKPLAESLRALAEPMLKSTAYFAKKITA